MSVVDKKYKQFSINDLNIWILRIWLFSNRVFHNFSCGESNSSFAVSLQILPPLGKSTNVLLLKSNRSFLINLKQSYF